MQDYYKNQTPPKKSDFFFFYSFHFFYSQKSKKIFTFAFTKLKLMKKHEQDDNYQNDELWKKIIEELPKEFVAFFFPDLYPDINWDAGYNFLKQEFSKLAAKSKSKKRSVDQILEVHLKDDKLSWILIHIEIQGYEDEDFGKRMFEYYYRIHDKHRKPITAIAIYTDANKNFKPNEYKINFAGTEITYKFHTYKILKSNEKELLESANPFALIVLAGKYALHSKNKEEQRKKFKFKLIRLLIERNYPEEVIEKILIFVDSLLHLSDELESDIKNEILLTTKYQSTMEFKIQNTSFYRIFKEVIGKEYEQQYDQIVREKDQIVREKDQIVREKDQIVREKEREKNEIIIHSIEKLLEKKFPISEIAECLGISISDVNQLIEKHNIKTT